MIEIPFAKNGMNARKFLEQEYLPNITGRVLFVGVASYTAKYPRMVPKDCLFETIDINPDRAQFGSPARHYIGDFLKHEKGLYDHIVLMGLDPFNMPDVEAGWWSWSVDLICKAYNMLTPEGTVLWGGTVGEGWESIIEASMDVQYDQVELFQYGTATRKGALMWLKRKS